MYTIFGWGLGAVCWALVCDAAKARIEKIEKPLLTFARERKMDFIATFIGRSPAGGKRIQLVQSAYIN